MHRRRAGVPMGMALAAAVFAVSATLPIAAAIAQGEAVVLVPHRAIYDLKLSQSRGRRAMQAVHGRILYDFSGNACEGYALRFRQMSVLDSGEGKPVMSDLRANTWEEGEARSLRFNSQSYLNDQLRESVDGFAQRGQGAVGVLLTKPGSRSFDLAPNLVFPTEHVRRIIAAAREGKTLLEASVYDGSETGEKVYDTLAVIGAIIKPGEKPPADAAAKQPALAALPRWPVTVSYFERTEASGDKTPIYVVGFEIYDNGISRALTLDYGDFVLSGELTSLEIQKPKPCP
ncbi:MAG TPA: cell envelope integrity EipB family protein [Xanthobacteraceae bacterium]|nr:cell envelope integrity EipB family protein [Xanthobacteraceae bacterium]